MDCDSDYDDSVVIKHGEINGIVARFNLSPEEDVQFRKRIEELELKVKADPGSESATLIKEIRACQKVFERRRNLEIEICAIYDVIL